MRHPLVLCLGNEILCDDAFGPIVARRLSTRTRNISHIDVVSASVAGFALLDHLSDRPCVLVVDTIITGHARPGTLHLFEAGELVPSHTLTNSHQVNLPTAIALGKKLGLNMPDKIMVLAVEALDVETLSEQMTSPVSEAIEPALDQIELWMKSSSAAATVIP